MANIIASAPAPSLRRWAGPPRNRRSGGFRCRHTYGAVDLGTNNCRLLIAKPVDGGFTVVDAFSRIVRLGEGLSHSGSLSAEAMDRAVGALSICAEKLRRRNVSLVSLGRDRGVPARRERRGVRRAGPPRNRHRARHHRAAGGGAAGGPRLPQAARAGRRTGADLRHRRRVDGACPGRPGRRRPEDPQLVERAVGRRFADRKRRQERARRPGPAAGLWPDAGARAAGLRELRLDASRATPRHPAAGHERHGDHAGKRPPCAAGLRSPRGRRPPRARRRDAEDQHDDRRDGS